MTHVKLKKGVCQRSKEMRGESYLKFQKCINELKQHGFLNQESPLAGNNSFTFAIDGDWVAKARREDRTLLGSRTFTIVVFELMPMSEFKPPPPPPHPETSGENWMTKAAKTILQFFHRPYLLILTGITAFLAIAVLLMNCEDGCKMRVEMQTDGDRMNSNIQIDNRQPE